MEGEKSALPLFTLVASPYHKNIEIHLSGLTTFLRPFSYTTGWDKGIGESSL